MTDSVTIDCGERLSIEQVEKLYASAEQALATAGDISLIAGQVQYCDTAGLQLVLSLQRTLEKTGHRIHWQSVSDSVREISAYLGLTSELNLSE
ncbi:STAS domain-containing protein [Thalassolituus hydrocarboniclasticus]|uniref:STAS domain-containing protein n=1 Tax=Thalassolituus hydrocarboniclasticus TaxID=2742796 RepID=A0ABY6AB25_9GAMM|nr:STAS domain-containing protein [Thalassolituus hydrocarboniclasticus]UXD88236.1 STAS domain-containing protein [Thalassolituus hydrocarboniclasticus]